MKITAPSRPRTTSPGITSAPPIRMGILIPIIVECAEPEGPYGAKGLGEPGLAPTPAAIGNAVADALGIRIYDLPLKPENVYWAIQGKNKKDAA